MIRKTRRTVEVRTLLNKSNAIAAGLTSHRLIRPSGPVAMARNPLERAAALSLANTAPIFLEGRGSLEQRLFLFRTMMVPVFCRMIINRVVDQEKGPKYWLWEHATYALAFERMLLEMQVHRPIISGETVLDYLANPARDHRFWIERFDQWRESAGASYNHFIKKVRPEIKDSAMPSVAHLKAMRDLSGSLPENLFGSILSRLQNDPVASLELNRAKVRKPARWGEREVDTWLIEIWPLVTGYGWNYSDILQVADAKWENSDTGALKSVRDLKDRCKKMLNLKLSPRGQAKQGRPKNNKSSKLILPTCGKLALYIESIGVADEEWITGQVFLIR